jgi:fused signal recognition particle receptor
VAEHLEVLGEMQSGRGGVALAVASEARLPIRFIGAGETIRDLRPLNSFEFVEALLAS